MPVPLSARSTTVGTWSVGATFHDAGGSSRTCSSSNISRNVPSSAEAAYRPHMPGESTGRMRIVTQTIGKRHRGRVVMEHESSALCRTHHVGQFLRGPGGQGRHESRTTRRGPVSYTHLRAHET